MLFPDCAISAEMRDVKRAKARMDYWAKRAIEWNKMAVEAMNDDPGYARAAFEKEQYVLRRCRLATARYRKMLSRLPQ